MIEALLTNITSVRLLFRVNPHMMVKILLYCKCFPTNITLVESLSSVDSTMSSKIFLLGETQVTNVTVESIFFSVSPFMNCQILVRREPLVTNTADKSHGADVLSSYANYNSNERRKVSSCRYRHTHLFMKLGANIQDL